MQGKPEQASDSVTEPLLDKGTLSCLKVCCEHARFPIFILLGRLLRADLLKPCGVVLLDWVGFVLSNPGAPCVSFIYLFFDVHFVHRSRPE